MFSHLFKGAIKIKLLGGKGGEWVWGNVRVIVWILISFNRAIFFVAKNYIRVEKGKGEKIHQGSMG